MNVFRYIQKINSLFDGRTDKKYEMYEYNGIHHPIIAQFQKKDIGCFFISQSPDLKRGYAELKNLRIYNQNKGYGTKLLTLLCKEADKYQVTLFLMPLADKNKEAISLNKLKIWYKKFGFVLEGDYHMQRKPIKDTPK